MSENFNCKYFSITDPQGIDTVIYRINKTEKELQAQYPKYTVERLVSTKEQKGNLNIKTFYLSYPDLKGDDLIFLSFGNEKVIVNTGKLKDNKLKVLKSPLPIKFNSFYSETQNEIKEFKYTPNLKRPITIIDPETTKEINPMVFIDKNTNEVKGKCTLKPYKSYFAFEIKDI